MSHKGYKAFEKGLICKGKQYAENTVFEESKASPCNHGMHYCENPFDVLNYYPLVNDDGELSEFAEVESLDKPLTDDQKKYCTTKLKVGAKLTFAGFVKACINFVVEKTKVEIDENDCGYNAKMASSGYNAQMASSGDYAKMASSGDNAKMASSGNGAQMASSGDYAKMASSGNGAQMASSGDGAQMAEWKWSDEKNLYIPVCVKTEQVDGERIKEDTFYMIKDGKFAEV